MSCANTEAAAFTPAQAHCDDVGKQAYQHPRLLAEYQDLVARCLPKPQVIRQHLRGRLLQ
jgi:hypothetical protein